MYAMRIIDFDQMTIISGGRSHICSAVGALATSVVGLVTLPFWGWFGVGVAAGCVLDHYFDLDQPLFG